VNAESEIRKMVLATLSDNHRVDAVRFVDQLLDLSCEVGKIRCWFAGGRKLSFQVQDQPSWEVELERAKAKLRMLCANLGVRCNETGGSDVSIYGGTGVIRKELTRAVNNGPSFSTHAISDASPPRPRLLTWEVGFRNTPSAQEFTIRLQ